MNNAKNQSEKDQRFLKENWREQQNISYKGTIKDRNSKALTEAKEINNGGKNIQNNYIREILMTQITMMV